MIQQKIEKIFPKIIKVILALALVIPILYAKNLLFLFVTTKAFTFYFLIELAIILFAGLVYFDKKYLSPGKKNIILLILLAYLAIKAVSALFGVSFYKSFWGGYERMMGLFTWSHLLVFFVLLISFFKKKKDFWLLFDVSIATSALISVYGLFQKLNIGGEFIVHKGIDRLDATIGNSAFLAAYLIFNIFFALYLLLKKEGLFWKSYYSAVILFEAIILFFTATRGGILGLFIGFGIFLFLNLFLSKNKKVRISSALIIFLFLFFSGFIYKNKESDFVQKIEPLRRITNVSFADATVKSRLLLWRKSLIIFKKRPLLGWGGNNITSAIDNHYTEDINEDWFDSTHNIIFDNLIAYGILGALLYLFLFFYLFFVLFKGRRENKKEFLVFIPLLTAYLSQNLFLFDNLITLLMFLLVMAFMVPISYKRRIDDKTGEKMGYSVFIVVILLSVAIVSAFLNLKALKAAYYTAESKRYSIVSPTKSIELYAKAINTAFYGFEDIGNMGADWERDIFNKKMQFNGNINDLIILTKKATKKAIEIDPLYSKNYLVISKILQMGRKYDKKYLDESIAFLEKAISLSPKRLSVYNGLAQAYYYKGDYKKGAEYLNLSLEFSTNVGKTYYDMAVLQILEGDVKGMEESLNKSLQRGYKISLDQYLKLVNVSIDAKQYEKAIEFYKKAIEINPEKIDYYAGIATIYKEMGNKKKAKEYALKILEIDPRAEAVVNEFIENLD